MNKELEDRISQVISDSLNIGTAIIEAETTPAVMELFSEWLKANEISDERIKIIIIERGYHVGSDINSMILNYGAATNAIKQALEEERKSHEKK